MFVVVALIGLSGCDARPWGGLSIAPKGSGSEVIISGPPELGEMLLWIPEAIMTERGTSALYP